MATYEFACQAQGCYYRLTQRMTMAERETFSPMCPYHTARLNQVYTPAIVCISDRGGNDLINRHIRGEGDPVPGLSQAETMRVAKDYAKKHKAEKNQKPGSHVTRSFAGSGSVKNYYGAD